MFTVTLTWGEQRCFTHDAHTAQLHSADDDVLVVVMCPGTPDHKSCRQDTTRQVAEARAAAWLAAASVQDLEACAEAQCENSRD